MKENRHEITIITTCPFCGKSHEVECNEMDYLEWRDGACIQTVMPYLGQTERELLLSGICNTCWNRMFENEEEE